MKLNNLEVIKTMLTATTEEQFEFGCEIYAASESSVVQLMRLNQDEKGDIYAIAKVVTINNFDGDRYGDIDQWYIESEENYYSTKEEAEEEYFALVLARIEREEKIRLEDEIMSI